ncbi:MAG: hypothetical protein IPN90_13200 [Elusimicrobia bacterium]|nr:hypothetical protein [Elusimicrobiota bacterium]
MKRLPLRWASFGGIEGLPLIIVFSNVLVYLFNLFQPGLIDLLSLSHDALWAGQWWRLVTFVFVPPFSGTAGSLAGPSPFHVVMMFVWFLFLHTMVTALENAWGSARFTVYFLGGVVATALVGLLPFSGALTNGYLQASLFLAFATLFPDVEVLLFFILPVKVKWMGAVTWGSLGLGFLWGNAQERLTIAAGLVNYFLVLGPGLWVQARLRWRAFQNRRRFRGRP